MFKMEIKGNSEVVNRIRTKFNNKPLLYRFKIAFKIWYGFKKMDILWFLSGKNSERYNKWMKWN